MKITTWQVLLLVTLALVLAGSVGCCRSRSDGDRTLRSEAPTDTPSPTAKSQTVRRPVESPEASSQEPNLPLEINLKSPEVPEQIREPSPPVPEKPQK